MTTIAIKDGIFCIDKQMSDNNDRCGIGFNYGSCDKAVHAYYKDYKMVIGMTGSYFAGKYVLSYLTNNTKKFVKSGFSLTDIYQEIDQLSTSIIIMTSDTILEYEGVGIPTELDINNHHAFGSGSIIAYSAMDAGASAQDALQISCQRDVFTGEGIDIFDIDGLRSTLHFNMNSVQIETGV